jgi:hypothetical protein
VDFGFVMEGSPAVPLSAQVTPEWLALCAQAIMVQLNRDVARYWGGTYRVRATTSDGLLPGEIAVVLRDVLPNAPDAIAYHDVEGADLPVAYLSLAACSSLADVSTGISHELCETAGDASCNAWRDDGNGHEYAQEICDAVQSQGYPCEGIQVSDFVLPSFFGPLAQGPYSYIQATGGAGPSAPFATIAGGYQIQRVGAGQPSQVFGEAGPRAHRTMHPLTRPGRRGLGG